MPQLADRNASVPGSPPSRFVRAGWAAVSLAAASWAAASLTFPFGWDQGMMASVGDIVLRGGLPFKDGWDLKGPFAFLGFAAAEFLFGRNMWGIRVLELGLLALACVALRRVDSRFGAPRGGTVAAAGLVLGMASLGWFHTAQPDGWVTLLTTVAFVPLLTDAGRSPARLTLAGVCVGACSLVKPFYAVLGLVPVYWAFVDPAPWRTRLVRASAVVAGAMLVPLVTLAWFAYGGGLHDLFEVQVGYNLRALSTSVSGRRVRFLRAAWYGLATAPALAAGALTLWRIERRACHAASLWLVLAVGCVVLQGKFFVYQWAAVFGPVALLSGIGVSRMLVSDAENGGRAGGPAVLKFATLLSCGAIAVWLALQPVRDVGRWLAYLTGEQTRVEYYDQFQFDNYKVGDEIRAADYIAAHSAPNDRVVVFGNDATVGYLSGRPHATRFVYGLPLTRAVPGFRETYRREFLETIQRTPPAFVVIGVPFEHPDKAKALREFPEFEAQLLRHFHHTTSFGFLDIWEPNQPS